MEDMELILKGYGIDFKSDNANLINITKANVNVSLFFVYMKGDKIMTRDCINDIELRELINKLKERNIEYCVYKNEDILFVRGHKVKYTVNYNSDLEFK